MAGVNKAILVGHLGADPEVRYTASGTAVGNFRIATSESWNDKQGQRQERTEWHRIVCWGKLAELAGEYLSKGRQVYIEGRLQTRQWDDRDGNKRYTTEIVAREMNFLGGRRDANATPHANANAGGPSAELGGGAPSAPQASGNTAPDGNGSGGSGGAGSGEGGFDYGPPPMTEDDVPF